MGEYLTPGFGVVVEPAARRRLIVDLVAAVLELTPEKRRALGRAAQREIAEKSTWPAKARQVLEHDAEARDAGRAANKLEARA